MEPFKISEPSKSKRKKRSRRIRSPSTGEEGRVVIAGNTTPAAASSYRCSECDKAFSAYQALGGHMTSHRRKSTAPSDESSRSSTAASSVSDRNPGGRLHECSTCHTSFQSGRALGGHKRKHYEGVIGGTAAKSPTKSSDGATATSDPFTVSITLNFDLNMLPSPEQ